MVEHFVVVRPFVDAYGEAHEVGEQIIPGDTASPSMLIEIARQVQAGNLVRVPSGEGSAKPGKNVNPSPPDGGDIVKVNIEAPPGVTVEVAVNDEGIWSIPGSSGENK